MPRPLSLLGEPIVIPFRTTQQQSASFLQLVGSADKTTRTDVRRKGSLVNSMQVQEASLFHYAAMSCECGTYVSATLIARTSHKDLQSFDANWHHIR